MKKAVGRESHRFFNFIYVCAVYNSPFKGVGLHINIFGMFNHQFTD
jgi:hypothetical protein